MEICTVDPPEVVYAVHCYDAQRVDEISFDVGVAIKITRKSSDGWYFGTVDAPGGSEGWLPSNYVNAHEDVGHHVDDAVGHQHTDASTMERCESLGVSNMAGPPASHPVSLASTEMRKSMSQLLHKLKQVVSESRREKEGVEVKGDAVAKECPAAKEDASSKSSKPAPSATSDPAAAVSPSKPRISLPGPPVAAAEATKVVATYDADPSKPTELAFFKGDVIHVVSGDVAGGGWVQGWVEGAPNVVGLVPSNRVRVEDAPSAAAASAPAATVVALPVPREARSPLSPQKRRPVPVPRNRKSQPSLVKAQEATSAHGGDVGNQANSQTPASASPKEAVKIPASNASSKERRVAPRPATVVQDYEASADGELSLKAGDKVLVLSRDGEVWRGQVPRGPAGLFPASCVRLDTNNIVMKENRRPEDALATTA